MMMDPASCPVCGETKNVKLCSRCRLVGYCSVDHQKEHWNDHKPICKPPVPPTAPFKIQDDPDSFSGRVAIATKDFVQGSAIWNESPIFHYNLPRRFIDEEKEGNEDGTIEDFPESCVTCGRFISLPEEETKEEDTKKETGDGENGEKENIEGENSEIITGETENMEKETTEAENGEKETGETGEAENIEKESTETGKVETEIVEEVNMENDKTEEESKENEPIEKKPKEENLKEKKKEAYTKCSKCSWAVCSPQCEKAAVHSTNECSIFSKSSSFFITERDRRGHVLGTRACSIFKKNTTQWAKISQCVPSNILKSQQELLDAEASIQKWGKAEEISENGNSGGHFKIPPAKQERIQAQMTAITRLVGFSFPTDPQHEPKSEHAGIYPTAAFFENSCRSNCVWNIGPAPDFRMRIRAAIGIKKGERLTLDRLHFLNSYSGTRERQQVFRKRFKRPCKCSLCIDPTESGSFQSGIVCKCIEETEPDPSTLENGIDKVDKVEKNNKDNKDDSKTKKTPGYLIPIDPMDISDTAEHKCTVCGQTDKLSNFLEKLNKVYDPFLDAATINLKKALIRWEVDKVIASEKKFLHPNHWVIQKGIRMDHAINGVPKFEGGEFEKFFPELKRIIDHHNIVLKALDKTHPGLHEERVRVMVVLGDILMWMCNRICERTSFQDLSRDETAEVDNTLAQVRAYWEEAFMYWDKTPVIVTTPAALAGRVVLDEPPNLTERLHAAKRLQEHINAKQIDHRRAAEAEDEEAEIKEWEFSYRKKKEVA